MTPDWHLTLGTDADIEELADFCHLQQGKAGKITAEYVRWQQIANPAGPGHIVLAKEQGSGKIIGVISLVPLRIRLEGKDRLGLQMTNILVHPDFRRHGIYSALAGFCNELAVQKGYQFTYGFPNPRMYPGIVGRPGWEDIGQVHLYLRALNARRLIKRRLGNGVLQEIIAVAGEMSGRFLFHPRRHDPALSQITVSRVDTRDRALDDFWDRVRNKYPVMLVRDAAFLHWRYGQIPDRGYQFLVARQDGRIVAFVTLRHVFIEGISCGMVVDFLTESTQPGQQGGEILLRHAAKHFQGKDVDLCGCLMLPHAEELALLRRQGYILCPARLQPQPHPVTIQTHNGTADQEMLGDIHFWFLTMGDFDAV